MRGSIRGRVLGEMVIVSLTLQVVVLASEGNVVSVDQNQLKSGNITSNIESQTIYHSKIQSKQLEWKYFLFLLAGGYVVIQEYSHLKACLSKELSEVHFHDSLQESPQGDNVGTTSRPGWNGGRNYVVRGRGTMYPQKIIFQWGGECNHVRTLLEEDKTGTIHCEARKDITLNCIMLNQFMLQSHQSVRKSSTM